jgi:hypothetical protein
MVSPLNRLLLAALVMACLCAACGAAAALASPAPRLGNAVAVGTGDKATGIAGVCARRAKRKVLRSSGATASAKSTRKPGAAGTKMKRRTKALRRR